MNEKLKIFEAGWPHDKDTVCGWSSNLQHTENIRYMLPRISKGLNIQSINDAGCGDLFWMQHMNLTGIDYAGYDSCERHNWPELREKGWKLETIDICNEDMRDCDLIFCRDVFIHLPNNMILDALDRFKKRAKYLCLTNFLQCEHCQFSNFDRITEPNMKHSKLDLRLKPFDLGPPLWIIPETTDYKSMSIWRTGNEL